MHRPDPLATTCVVIPTFNESDNIVRLIEALKALSSGLKIIIIDDASPDGTGKLVDVLVQRLDGVSVLHRDSKKGRGSAVLEGFSAALADETIQSIVEMDADFSHDPSELKEMILALESCDMLVRSRYAPGSRIEEWGPARLVFSRLANIFARTLLRIPLSDYTNGYRAYTRKAVAAIKTDAIDSAGYIVLSEVALQLHEQDLRIAELPTVFINRRRGQSNLGWGEIASAFTGILRLWKHRR